METNSFYYRSELEKVFIGIKTIYSPTIKIFANGNGEDTKHLSLNDESAKVLIEWLQLNFPNCMDKKDYSDTIPFDLGKLH